MQDRWTGRSEIRASTGPGERATAPTETDEAPGGDAADPFAVATRALAAAGVRWCRLREHGGGPEDDLLVEPADLATARRALARAGWHERRHPGHGSHRQFHAFDASDGRWRKIDIVTTLDYGRWQEWRSGLAGGCLERAVRADTDWALAGDDAFWTLLLHDLLDRPAAEPRRPDRLRELAAGARSDGPGAAAARRLLPRWTRPGAVIEAAAHDDLASLVRIGRAMQTRMGRQPGPRARRSVSRVLRWIDHRDPPFLRRGRTVALLGPDGAGKTSLAERVGHGGPMARRTVYLGLYGGARGGARRRHLPGVGLVRRVVAMWRGWLIGAWHARRGRLVIFDRHPLDARLGAGRSGSADASGRLRRAILGNAIPPPDVVIVLDAPADLLYARKPEHPLERIEQQRARYRALAERLDRAMLVDATPSLEGVAREITAIVWDGPPARVEAR